MEDQKIISQLKKKIYSPVYLLHGEEPFFIDKISDYIEEHVLDESEKAFNQTVVYGKDTEPFQLISMLKEYPAGAPYKVVIVKEAQDIKNLENLENYLEKPVPTSILVLSFKHKKVDKRKKFYLSIKKKGVIFESKPVYENKIPQWINDYVHSQGYTITDKSVLLLTEYLGNNLGKITNEVQKLLINIPKDKQIDENDIEKNIGISKDFNVFELQDALGIKDVLKVNRIINYFAANEKEHHAIKVIAMLYAFFHKLFLYHFLEDKSKNTAASKLGVPPYFVHKYAAASRKYPTRKLSDIMHHLRVYDLKAKGLNNDSTSSGELLKELTFKILH